MAPGISGWVDERIWPMLPVALKLLPMGVSKPPWDLAIDLVHNAAMAEVGVHAAKTNLSRLLRRVAAGEEIIITRGGDPVARLVPASRPRPGLGMLQGALVVPDDFDAPLPDDILAQFER